MGGIGDWGLGIRYWRAGGSGTLIPTRSLIPSSRSGISLIEVLFSIAILLTGLWLIAAMIPLGKLALVATEKSDRTGACGRAALQDLKVRKMLDYTTWGYSVAGTFTLVTTPPSIAVIDPLGCAKSLSNMLGGTSGTLTRYTLAMATTTALAEPIFLWHDELRLELPDNVKGGTIPAGTRPLGMFIQSNGSVTCPAVDGTPVTSAPAIDGNFSWFLTVVPQFYTVGVANYPTGLYSVAAVVCYKRVLTQTGTQPDGERVQSVTCDCGANPSYGGVSVTVSGANVISDPANPSNTVTTIKNDLWVLLYSTGTSSQYTWYRAVNAGYDGANTHINLVGPDWYGSCGTGGTAANLLIVGGVTGVYTTTVQLN